MTDEQKKKLEEEKRKAAERLADKMVIAQRQRLQQNQNISAEKQAALNVLGRTGKLADSDYYKQQKTRQVMQAVDSEREAKRQSAGWKKVGGKVVWASGSAGLPDTTGKNAWRLGTKAQAPAAYGIELKDYLSGMKAFDRYRTMNEMPEADEETQAFLDKWFSGKVPTAEEFSRKYDQVMNDMSVPDEDVKYFFENGADLVGKAMPEREKNDEEYAQVLKDREKAIALLGEDAEKWAGRKTADYYEQYSNTFDRKDIAEKYEQEAKQKKYGLFEDFGEADAILQGVLHRGEGTTEDKRWASGNLLANQNMTDEQRTAYLNIASKYGEEAAAEYYNNLLRDGGYNEQAFWQRDQALRTRANDNWLAATAESLPAAPMQVYGTMYSIGQVLKGEEIDPYSNAFAPGQWTQTPRDEVNQMITRSYGKKNEATGEREDTLGSWLMKAGYNALTSGADSATSTLLGGGVPSAGAALQALWGFGGTAQDATMRDAETNQALLLAGVNSVIGFATDKMPMETLAEAFQSRNVKSIKNILGHALAGVISEAPGEAISELGNSISDSLIMGKLSRWNESVRENGKEKAALDLVGDILTSGFVGALSGAGSNTLAASGAYLGGKMSNGISKMKQGRDQAEVEAQLSEAAAELAGIKPENPAQETGGMNVPKPAQEAGEQAETAKAEEEEAPTENGVKTPEKAKNAERFKQVQSAALETEAGSRPVSVIGIDSVGPNGRIMLEVEDENGKREVVNGADVTYDSAETEELMAYDAEKLDAKALRFYLEDYDSSLADAEQYALAFTGIYNRAKAGVDYEQAALANTEARRYLTQDAMIDAFAAGQNAYNQKHETVQPAAVETVKESVPARAPMSAKEKTGQGRISRRYTQEMFDRIGTAGRKNAIAQMELLGAIASRTKRTITIVDTIVDENGQHANAMYDPKTGEIRVALDATESAYAYAAMHELTHAMKNEHSGEWDAFAGFVKTALNGSGQSWDSLVQYQMDQFGYTREQAEEEVVCNTVPALLQDERNVLKLYKGNRTLFDRVVDWVKGLLQDVKTAGEKLSHRSKSWAQMDMLAKDRKTLQEMYDRMMQVMESEGTAEEESRKNGLDVPGNNVVKMSAKESDQANENRNLTQKDVENFKSIGRKNISEFSSEDFEKASNMAESLYQEIGVKSPFFRNWFGDWRAKDTTPVAIVTQKSSTKGDKINADTGWKINVGKQIFRETSFHKSAVSQKAVSHLDYLDGIVESAVLLDSYVSDKDNKFSTMFHSMYAVVNNGTNEAVIKLTVEQFDDFDGSGRSRRAYKLTNVEEAPAQSIALQATLTGSTSSGYTVADMFAIVNKKDSTFNPKEASQIVNEDGSPKVVYHGTASEFWSFDKKKANDLLGRRMGLGAGGGKFYLTEHKGSGNAAAYSAQQAGKGNQPKVMELYVSARKVMDRSEYNRRLNELYAKYPNSDPKGAAYDYRQRDKAIAQLDKSIRKEGYDGVWDKDSGELFVYEPTQIKSATDNVGTFDASNPDIRYSLRDTDENVQSMLAEEEKALALVKGYRITAGDADALAGAMLKTANSTYDRQRLAAEISRTMHYAATGEDVDMRQIDDELTDIASRVMAESRTLDLEHEQAAKPVRDYLRNTRIRLTSAQKAEAENLTGSYNAYRKALFGRVRLNSTAGTTLDSLWGELHQMAPQWFAEDASEGDMPRLLMEAVDAAKPVFHTGMGMNAEESANWLAGKLMQEYFALPAVRAGADSAKRFGDSVRALKEAMKRFEDSSWTDFQHALRELKEARTKEQRTEKQKEVAALREKYKKWRSDDTARRKERELKNKYTGRIERTAQVLMNWMDKPTDAKHIPDGLRDTVVRMLTSLDFKGKDTKTSRELSERIDKLADVLREYQENEDEGRSFFLDRDQQLIDEIKRLAELIRSNSSYQGQSEGRGVYDLNSGELRELSKWLEAVRHNIMEAGKLRGSNLEGYESVEQAAVMSMEEMSRKKPQKDKTWATKAWNEAFGADMQDSFTFFERLGPTGQDVFMGLRQGFDDMVQMTRQAEEHSKTLLEGADMKALTGRKASKQKFDLSGGGTVEMTKANIMELYVLSKREQAKGHLLGGGIRVIGDEDVRPHPLTKRDIKAITDTLTEDEKRIADGMQQFLSRECAAWGNETSRKLVGYEKFGEKNYWPIKTDSNERSTKNLDGSYAADINAIRNQGMTKQTQEGASNAILIGDIFDTYTRHISNMAAYSAYSIPLSDFSRWYNTRGVKTEIEQLTGRKGIDYINTFLMAMNGSALQEKQSGLSKAAGMLSRNAKIASVGANVRVVVQQPTSYARAAMYMSPKYLTQALAMKKPDAELIGKYCGIAQWKRWGFYETNIGPNLRQMLVGDQSTANKLREMATAPAAWGDNWTLNHLWNACELETRAESEYEIGSEAYYQQVGKRMSGIIDRTQVVDSVFHRSQMMRSRNAWNQMLSNFMSEPTKTYNMLAGAMADYSSNRKNKAAQHRLARAITVYAVTGVLTAAAAAVVDAFRDDDAEKEWLEKYTDAFRDNTIDNLNPSGMLPGVKDIMSLIQGYDAGRLDQQSLQKIIWAAQEIDKYVKGESKQNLYGVTYKTAQALSSLFGIPVSNVMRDLNAIVQTVTGETPTLTAEARKNQTITHLYKAINEKDKKRAESLRESLRSKAGMSPREIDTAIAKMLEEDPRIAEAWKAKTEKRYTDLNRAKNALTASGFSSETVDKAISSYENSMKEKKEKDPNEELNAALYTEKEVVSAIRMLAGVEKGGTVTKDDIRAMMSERIESSTAKNPEKSVKSGIQSELKKDYLAMEKKGDVSGMKRLGRLMKELLGTTEQNLTDWVNEAHGEDLREAVDSYNSRAAIKAVETMRKDGKTDSQIKSALSKYKQIYIDAVKSGNRNKSGKIKEMLIGLGLKGKNGKPLYSDATFEEWLK